MHSHPDTGTEPAGHRGNRRILRVAAVALLTVTAGAVGASGIIGRAGADTPAPTSTFTPITPCRLVDTRPTDLVGTRDTPIGPGQTAAFQVRGSNGNCTIPDTAIGIATNTTAVNPTVSSFLTVWPADAPQPLTSNLNWTPTSPPTPNQVTVGLSSSGAIHVFNNGGTVDVIIDIVGYYVALPAPVTPPAQQPPTVYTHARSTSALMSSTGGVNGSVTVNPMFLPTGKYLVTFTGTVVNFSGAGDYFRCSIYVVGSSVAGQSVWLDSGNPVAPMTVQAVVTLSFEGSSAVGSTCQHDSALAGCGTTACYVDPGATLTAVPITEATQ
jgi:hypothetical protein